MTMKNPMNWKRSTHCKRCVEIAKGDDNKIYIRDSRHPEIQIPVLPHEFSSFMRGIKEEQFDEFM